MLKSTHRTHLTGAIAVLIALTLLASTTYADMLFMGGPYLGNTHLYRYNTDDGPVSPSVIRPSETGTMRNVAVDPGEGRVYWANNNSYAFPTVSFIGSSDYNGNNVSYFSFEASVMCMAYHPDNDHVYYGKVGNGGGGSVRSLIRADSDGTSPLEIASFTTNADAVALDLAAGKLYWAARESSSTAISTIWRSNLDGTGVETFLTGHSYVQDLAVDGVGGELFWSSGSEVFRAPLDMSAAPTSIFTGTADGIALSPDASGIYYSDDSSYILHMDTNGNNSQVVTGVYRASCIAVVPEPATLALLSMGGLAILCRRKRATA